VDAMLQPPGLLPTVLAAVFAPSLLVSSAVAAGDGPVAGAIAPSASHPRYWARGGDTVLLLGGSKEDNLFQVPDLEEHLDLLAASGGNYVRCTMSSRDEGNVWPFHYDAARGLYDLERWNDEYWARFERFLAETDRRGIVVQVEIWATFDFYRENWDVNPFNPENNVNYTPERTKLPVEVPTHPVFCDNRFFWSVPDHDNNMPVLEFQQRFVDKLLSYTFRHGNVLYCMDNETSVTAAWGRFWSTYIKKRAAEAGVVVQTTEMWDPWDLDHISHRETFDHPETYSFVDISQNNHQRGQAHWDNGLRQIDRLQKAGHLRPVTNVKTYGADGSRHGGDTNEAVAKFIRSACFGSAAVRFHRPPSGIGLSETAQAVIRSVRDLSDRMAWFDAAPRNDLLRDRDENEAYCRAVPGRGYTVYFPDGGGVTLDLSALEGEASLTWLEVLEGRWSTPRAVAGGAPLPLDTPGPGHWIALITSE
jgi:hypothetical protein